MLDILSFISSFINSILLPFDENEFQGPLVEIANFIFSLPGLSLFVLIPFVGLGIGLIKRIIKLN